MTRNGPTDAGRTVALDGYLETREADGYRIETRSAWQAVIVRRRQPYFLLRLGGPGRSQRRFVVSVDEAGAVTAIAAEPRRW
jgi:hypothetical protein